MYGGGGGGGYGGGRGGGRGGGGGGGRGGGRTGGRKNYDGDPQDPGAEQFRKLFIGGLSYETTEEGLRGHFEQWGEIVDCVVMKDPQSKRSRGFGFVTYKEAAMLDDAQANRPHVIDRREVESKRAMPREGNESQESVKKMFVGGCKDDTDEDMVRQTFESYGSVEAIDILKDKQTGKSKSFCFVTFEDYDSVDKCVLKKKFMMNGKQVEVKKAQPKGEKKSNDGGRMMSGGNQGGWGNQGNFGGGGGGGTNYGGGFNQGGGYGNQSSYGGGYNQGGGWNQGGGGGGGYGDGGYGGGYSNQGAGNWGGGQGGGGANFGQNYGNSYGGGPMKGGGGYSQQQRGGGPYSGGGGGGGGYGGGRF